MKFFFVIFTSILLASCSAETNINQFFTTSKQNESFDLLVYKANYFYNKGKFTEALGYGEKAIKVNPGSEQASVVLGYIYLALAGIDTFDLAKNLIKNSSTKLALAGTTDTLSSLSSIISVTDADLRKLATTNNQKTLSSGTVVKGKSDLSVFSGMEVLLPLSATQARAAGLNTLTYVNKAITAICPFIPGGATLSDASGDGRHSATACPPSSNPRYLSAKSLFLWAFSHLTEALIFNNVILYKPSGSTNISVEARSSAISNTSLGITDMVSGSAELANVVDLIFPTNDTDSMLRAMVNDLKATNLAFSNLPGIPDSVTKSVTSLMSKIETTQKSIQKSGGSSDSSSAALKNQLTTKLSATLKTRITSLSESGSADFTGENKTNICSSYAKISGDSALTACQ